MTAQSSPMGSPWTGQVLSSGPGQQNPATSVIAGSNGDEGNTLPSPSTAGPYGGPYGMNVIQFSGQVIAVNAPQRTLWVQTQVFGGQAITQRMMVIIPAQVNIISPAATYMSVDMVHAGQSISVSGLQNAAGAVEARMVQMGR